MVDTGTIASRQAAGAGDHHHDACRGRNMVLSFDVSTLTNLSLPCGGDGAGGKDGLPSSPDRLHPAAVRGDGGTVLLRHGVWQIRSYLALVLPSSASAC